jgi:hypothetical protein
MWLNQKGAIMDERIKKVFVATAVCLTLALSSGCGSTNPAAGVNAPESPYLTGAGMGALLGQSTDGSKTATPTGADVSTQSERDTSPLANTAWQIVSVIPKPAEPMKSKVERFNADGTLTTTTTYWDGRTVTDTNSERYRVVGQTLIIKQDGWAINATFLMDGDSLYVDSGTCSLVLERLWSFANRDKGI